MNNAICHQADICVIGGGMAGMIAAISAARHGARVVLMHDRPVLGGNASSEIRMWIRGAAGRENRETGILQELELENIYRNPTMNYSLWDSVLLQAVMAEKNITLLLNCSCLDCQTAGNRITSVTGWQLNTYAFHTVEAQIFLDCSGDSILAPLCGAAYRVGREGQNDLGESEAPAQADRKTMGNSCLIEARQTDHPCPFTAPEWANVYPDDASMMDKNHDFIGTGVNFWWIELGGEQDTIADTQTLNMELLKIAFGVWDHIKNGGDHGAQNFDLEWVGMLPGVRESRRMEGEYMLNENDLLENRVFDDAVAYGGWPVDNHVEHGLLDFDKMPSEIYAFNGLYTIPYRSYVAKDMDNLFIGGRSMGASKLAMASSRVMGTCAVGGQAVGTAAALCKKYGCTPHDVEAHMKELQQLLLKDDCYIPGYKNEDPADLARTAQVSAGSEKQPAANVINGVSRTVGEDENCWQSDGLAGDNGVLSLKWDAPHTLRQVRLTFDPNLCSSIKITLSSKRIAEQVPGVPPELVRDYDVELLKDGHVLASRSVRGNYQRLNVLNFDACDCDEVRLHVLATNGIADARVYEVRAYEQAD